MQVHADRQTDTDRRTRVEESHQRLIRSQSEHFFTIAIHRRVLLSFLHPPHPRATTHLAWLGLAWLGLAWLWLGLAWFVVFLLARRKERERRTRKVHRVYRTYVTRRYLIPTYITEHIQGIVHTARSYDLHTESNPPQRD